jgi:hypothetical protein
VCGSVLFAARESGYFSPSNIAFGHRALRVMKEPAWSMPGFTQFASMVHVSFGYAFVIAAVAAIVAGLAQLNFGRRTVAREHRAVAAAGLFGSIIFSIFGGWFWLIETSGGQVRFFFPFGLMAAIGIIPLALLALEASAVKTRNIVRMLLVLPSLNILALLAMSHPPQLWQRISGVNLAAEPISPDVLLGRRLLHAVKDEPHGSNLYAASSSETAVLESYIGFEGSKNTDQPLIRIARPVDWQRSTTFRLAEIEDADFILFSIVRDPLERAQRLAIDPVDSYAAEQSFFEAWLSDLSKKDGVQEFADTDKLRLLRVVDRPQLRILLEGVRRSKRWSSTFLDANPQRWWSKEAMSSTRLPPPCDGATPPKLKKALEDNDDLKKRNDEMAKRLAVVLYLTEEGPVEQQNASLIHDLEACLRKARPRYRRGTETRDEGVVLD